ncbi:MAG TPA: serine/threonine-protein kinase [Candidatus Limnocylindria bacterium]|nr:serine/threonine-protein kinase [Candidatus Limnocylindria bacterium]
MSSPPSQRDVEVFSEAVNLTAADRTAYLDHACAGDEALRQRVEVLLRTHDHVGDFLEQSPQQEAIHARPGAAIGERPGDWIGRYKLLQQIGEGGCGVVYMAEQEEPLRRRVALKIIKPGMDTKSVIARFEAERQALALMDHPNIAKVLDAGATDSGRPYFVMELVRGVKITEYCDQNSLTTDERLNLFIEVCRAVQHAHQKGIIHRDIKPSNILVTRTLEGAALPVVIDFGIAKATTSQRLTDKTLFTAFEMLIGTPAYMSPEQAALTNADVDTRTDIYSLGVLLYELLTGSTPFDTGELLKAGLDEVRRVIREREPVRPSTRLSRLTVADLTTVALHRKAEAPKLIRSVCGDLDWIVMKALEKDRTRRYETANGLARDVQRFMADEVITARPPSAAYRFRKLVSRHRVLFGALGAITLLLVVSLALVVASLNRERQARQAAQTEAIRSEQTTKFLKEMLSGVGPAVALGEDTRMLKGILDKTAARVGQEMASEPSIEAELRGLIGRLYLELGTYEDAEPMLKAALALHRKVSGSESKETAGALYDLGSLYWKQRKLAEAEAAHLEALRLRHRFFGHTNAEVADSLNALGGVYRRQKRLAESERITREAIDIRRVLFTGESLPVADSLHNLTIVLGDLGRMTEAEATAREMLALRRRLLPADHYLVAAALADVAWTVGFSGKLGEVEALETEALPIQRKNLGDTHPDVLKTLYTLGELMRQRGKLTESHTVLFAALSAQRKVLGEGHPDVLETLQGFGRALEAEGNWEEAETVHREALAQWRKRSGNEDARTLTELERLVHVLVMEKKFSEAKQLLDEALTPAFLAQTASANMLSLRMDLLGRRGQWHEAAADGFRLIALEPTEHYRYHTLAPVLAMLHDRGGYVALCQKILAAFPVTTNPYVAERMAKDSLLLPNSGADLQWAGKMADLAVTLGSGQPSTPFFQNCKALVEFRRGHWRETIAWTEKVRHSAQLYANAQACALQAMAHWQLGEKGEARVVLAEGEPMAPLIVPAGEHDEIGDNWLSWLCARIALDEAAALIRPGTSAEADPPRP